MCFPSSLPFPTDSFLSLFPSLGRALLIRHGQYYLKNNARGLVEVHHLVDNRLEKVLVTWERAKDGYLAPQGDGETGNKRKKGLREHIAQERGNPRKQTTGSELLEGS